jgi:hypothetical protein
MVPPDPQSDVSGNIYAVVYVPRRSRNRFPASCVDIKTNREEAISAANPDNKHYPALLHGPSKSSEGQYIYYLIEWIGACPRTKNAH